MNKLPIARPTAAAQLPAAWRGWRGWSWRSATLRSSTLRSAWLAAGLCAAQLAVSAQAAPAAAPPGALPVALPGALPGALPDTLANELRQLAGDAAKLLWPTSASPPRVEVVVGRLDPRLVLAPCAQIVPFLPPGARPLGATRIGLRCAKGSTAWRVTLPMQVKVWAPALVARTALPVGTVLLAQHLQTAEVDLAARVDAAVGQQHDAIGRTLQRGLAAGDALRSGDLKVLQYFNAGDTVRVVAVGSGFSISGEGQALGPGTAGRNAQVRLAGGRIVTGVATGERQLEVAL